MGTISAEWQKTANELALHIRLGLNVEAGMLLVEYVEKLANAYPPTDFICDAEMSGEPRLDWPCRLP